MGFLVAGEVDEEEDGNRKTGIGVGVEAAAAAEEEASSNEEHEFSELIPSHRNFTPISYPVTNYLIFIQCNAYASKRDALSFILKSILKPSLSSLETCPSISQPKLQNSKPPSPAAYKTLLPN
ncbi:hypothetical protein SDJN03_28150, partial [Cucurbita argyrosperma subsp. sororia]